MRLAMYAIASMHSTSNFCVGSALPRQSIEIKISLDRLLLYFHPKEIFSIVSSTIMHRIKREHRSLGMLYATKNI